MSGLLQTCTHMMATISVSSANSQFEWDTPMMKITTQVPMDIEYFDKDTNGCINPFVQDSFHMGTYIGKNVAIMYRCFENEECNYIIVIDRRTGERKKIQFN